MVAIATFVAVAAGCDQTKNCCFSGTLVVEVEPASNFVIIKGATRGLGCAYDQDIIECDLQQDGSCYNPFHVVVFGLNYVMITEATDNQSQTIANSTNPQADITVAGFYAIIQEGENAVKKSDCWLQRSFIIALQLSFFRLNINYGEILVALLIFLYSYSSSTFCSSLPMVTTLHYRMTLQGKVPGISTTMAQCIVLARIWLRSPWL